MQHVGNWQIRGKDNTKPRYSFVIFVSVIFITFIKDQLHMKKYFLIGIFFFLLFHGSKAQVSIKAISGVNIAWQGISLNNNVDLSAFEELNDLNGRVVKPFVGLQLNHNVNHFLDLNFEFQVSLKGQRSISGSYSETLSYLKYVQTFDIDVLKNLKFGGGMFWGLMMASEFEEIGPQSSIRREKWDAGMVSSISFVMNRFTLRVVYYHSITSLYRQNLFNSFGGFFGSSGKKNRTLQFGLGYTIMNKKKARKPLF